MTVAELIEQLRELPQDADVYIPAHKGVTPIVEVDEAVIDEMTGNYVTHADNSSCNDEHVVVLHPAMGSLIGVKL